MNLDFVRKIRRNHALEHATITIAQSRLGEPAILGGYSTPWGFFVYGDVPTEVLSQATSDALERLRRGERRLAISPFCGTNLVVGAVLTGLACAWAMGSRRRLSRLPRLFDAALAATLLAKPVGYQVQKHVTTDGAVGGLSIRDISHLSIGSLRVHRVSTSQGDLA